MIFQRLLYRFLSFAALFSILSITSLYAFEERHRDDFVAGKAYDHDDYRHGEDNDVVEEASLVAEVIEKVSERSSIFLSAINPLEFVIRFLLTFPVVHFLSYQLLKQAVEAGQAPPDMLPEPFEIKNFIYEGILFYVLNIMHKALTVTLEPILVYFKAYGKISRFLSIVFFTTFMGVSIHISSLWSLVFLITIVFLMSWLTAPEKKTREAFMYTNAIFAMGTWMVIQGIWYVFVTSDKLDDFLKNCRVVIDEKESYFEHLLMSSGNLGIVQIWWVIKDYLYVPEPHGGYIPLHQLLEQNQDMFSLQPVIEFINNLVFPFKEITKRVIENLIFEFARELFL